jgi:cell division protein FtsL
MRYINFLLAVALAVIAVVIYQVKYETRGLEQRVSRLQTTIAEERDAIGILRAEWSHLNRPARLERLARKHLGLRPLDATQVADRDAISSAKRESTLAPDDPAPKASRAGSRHQPIAFVN